MPSRPLSLALLGATGLVGRAVLDALPDAALELAALRLLGSQRSAGSRVEVGDDEIAVEPVREGAFKGCDVAIFCAPPEVARAWAPRARADGCAVVDASSAFRTDPGVPLVVPGVNEAVLDGLGRAGLAALPGGGAAALAVALAPLHAAARLEGLVVSILEPVSGAGARGLQQLEREATDLMNGREPDAAGAVAHRIAFNVVPQVGAFLPDGSTEAEEGLAAETRRVLAAPGLRLAVTALRAPIFYGQVASVHAITGRKVSAEEARTLLRHAPGVKLLDAPGEGIYPMPMLAVNDDAVRVGRIRVEPSEERGVALLVVSDALRQRAACALRVAARLAGQPAA
ncbi:MAG TPA: aspartate-semialdehyde dehydrogenase [Anaeromyxobacteraceae bacterium]|nr:aspartate-semialdehyde dehydrogenase [Anaeromyxobacteraceae bacterium]